MTEGQWYPSGQAEHSADPNSVVKYPLGQEIGSVNPSKGQNVPLRQGSQFIDPFMAKEPFEHKTGGKELSKH